MTYDYEGPWSPTTGLNSPLFAPGGESPYNVSSGMNRWVAEGMPRDQLLVGIPFFGHALAGVRDSARGFDQPFTEVAPIAPDYTSLSRYIEGHESYDTYWHSEAKVPWAYSSEESVFVSYDDPRSVGSKASWTDANAFGGLALWECFGDREGVLLPAIRNEIDS